VAATAALHLDFHAQSRSINTNINLIEDTRMFRGELDLIIQSASQLEIATNRAALFVQFSNPVERYRDANKMVRSILPKGFSVELSDEQDFILQLNRPRREEGLAMNFITKWSVDRVQILNLQFGGGQAQIVSEHLITAISFDNNNAPVASLTSRQVAAVLNEALKEVSKGLGQASMVLEGF